MSPRPPAQRARSGRPPAGREETGAEIGERMQGIADQADAMAQTCAERILQLLPSPGAGERSLARSIGERYAAMSRLAARLFTVEALDGARVERLSESIEILENDALGLCYAGDREMEGHWSSWWNLHEEILQEV